MRAARKGLAFAILTTFIGLMVEAQIPDGRWQRAPLTGAKVMTGAAVIGWAAHELNPEAAS
jgi:hypothetical protein